jgi:hypothetical protein
VRERQLQQLDPLEANTVVTLERGKSLGFLVRGGALRSLARRRAASKETLQPTPE